MPDMAADKEANRTVYRTGSIISFSKKNYKMVVLFHIRKILSFLKSACMTYQVLFLFE